MKPVPYEVAQQLVLLKRELSFLVGYGFNDDYEGQQETLRENLRQKIRAIEDEYQMRLWEQ